jgi:ABC transporter with metal-binding/Fe-S-binding domain ATP-binding protein
MKAAVLFTGGKDSTLAMHRAVESGLDVSVLVSIIPHYNYSQLYHKPPFEALKCQAQALGIPLETVGVCSEESEVEVLYTVLRRVKEVYEVKVLVLGAIKSKYQLRVFSEVASSLQLELYTPLWGIPEEDYLDRLLDYGLEFTVISVTSMGIPMSLLGKVINRDDVAMLKKLSSRYGFNISFEGGDAETFVLNAPLFRYKVSLKGYKKVISEYEGYFNILKCGLVKK